MNKPGRDATNMLVFQGGSETKARLHREGREFESLAAYQPSRFALRLGKPAGA